MGVLSVAKYFLGSLEIPNSADPCLYVYQVHPLWVKYEVKYSLEWKYMKLDSGKIKAFLYESQSVFTIILLKYTQMVTGFLRYFVLSHQEF